MTAQLFGVGVGPGDPKLITLAGVEAIRSADVLVYHARPGGQSTAANTASPYFHDGQIHELLHYPVTTGTTDHPGGYAGALADFYIDAVSRLRMHLDAGRTVCVLALGDPMLYSSYQHLHRELKDDYPTKIIPGVPSLTASASVLGLPLAEDDEVCTVLSGTLDESELVRRLIDTDSAVVMKLGRTFEKVRRAFITAGRAEETYIVIRVGMEGQHTVPLLDADPATIPYFSVAVLPSPKLRRKEQQESPQGEVVVLGLGPGAAQWTTPEVSAELRRATDIIGYSTYVRRVPLRSGQQRHLSDNKVEAERAAMALDLAKRGRKVAVVSSGDPGVFAMAAAVIETANDDLWRDVPVRVLPGMTAAQAVASRVGAPLGHDFGIISLSDRLKPWDQIEKRIRALAEADMAFAVYNPASKERRTQVHQLQAIVSEYQKPDTPIIVARAVGSAQENIVITTLKDFDPDIVDMRTMIIVGASTTTTYNTPDGKRVFTSRKYGM
ncbi:precorrin-3B C(17)-methyltransferase [Corynebacterium freiburgense]|uniref:precorrin-3B C(17)-methyltransferase n=1 Tax=Corynebacterium freiburgense TaxID=556548 RepID=UPI000416B683|nr:precorrin-3B C(17)-methyltransferase [Corynebacterium freiburgense]WJZ02612.1 Precorrin-3B C(17)-methyltransferase [Corynebacterium freiburgense]